MSHLIAIPASHDSWPQAYDAANFLLREGAQVLWATQPFDARRRDGVKSEFARGTFLVTEVPTDDSPDWISIAKGRFRTDFFELDTVEDFTGLPIRPLRIAMYGGGGAPFNHARIFAELGFWVDFITPQEIRRGKLAEVDLLGVPGGGGFAMKGQLDPLGEEGCRAITTFVQDGGMYIGSCAGSYDAAIVPDSFLEVCPQQREMQLVNALIWNRDDTEWVGIESPGVGVLESRNLRPDHPVMFGMPEAFHITHYNGPFFEPAPNSIGEASEVIDLAAVAGFTDDFTPSEYFLRFSEFDRATAEEETLVARAARGGRSNIIVGQNGLGRVALFGSHPEFGYNLAMDRWSVPARMLANAAFWQSSHLEHPRDLKRKVTRGTNLSFPPGGGLQTVSQKLNQVTSLVGKLRAKSKDTQPDWLEDELAMSTFGLSGRDIWQGNLEAFDDVAREFNETLSCTGEYVEEASQLLSSLREHSNLPHVDLLNDALLGLEEAIHYRTPEEWNQDFGYEGVLQMLDRTISMLQTAERNFESEFEPSSNPYEHLASSPYHLVVGSYLAAIGVFANAWFLLRAQECKLSELVFKAQATLRGS